MVRHIDITDAIEDFAPLRYQEEWDNSGYQCGNPFAECTGALICVDVTEDIVEEALSRRCNLIIAHHPLLFRGVKQVVGRNRVERVLAKALKNDITVYSSHTSMDNTPGGVSWTMAEMLGLNEVRTLAPVSKDASIGCGVVGNLAQPLTPIELVEKVKSTFGSPVARCSALPPSDEILTRIGLCGGAGTDFIPDAIRQGARAYITSDTKLNYFLDHVGDIFIIDIGHFESESCTKQIFYHILSEKFPNFALHYSEIEKNPINYL